MAKRWFCLSTINFFEEKQIRRKNLEMSVHQARNGQIWFNFGQKLAFSNFPRKKRNCNFFRLQRLGFKQKIIINRFREKCGKPSFLAFWAKKANFGQFLSKMGKTGLYFQKVFGTFFPRFWVLTNCKVSEKSNEGIPRKRVTNERTDVIP